jgi:hypothetical protein
VQQRHCLLCGHQRGAERQRRGHDDAISRVLVSLAVVAPQVDVDSGDGDAPAAPVLAYNRCFKRLIMRCGTMCE